LLPLFVALCVVRLRRKESDTAPRTSLPGIECMSETFPQSYGACTTAPAGDIFVPSGRVEIQSVSA